MSAWITTNAKLKQMDFKILKYDVTVGHAWGWQLNYGTLSYTDTVMKWRVKNLTIKYAGYW